MIRFALHCDQDHEFEGWFRNNEDFDGQLERKLVSCPSCGSQKISKALMAPSVSTGRQKEKIAIAMNAMAKELREITQKIKDNSDYVGAGFAEEARKIHFGEATARGIYGEATNDEVEALVEDGVDIMPLPVLPEDRN